MTSTAKVKAVFTSAILLLFFCAASSYLSFFYFRSSERWVSHTQEVRAVTGDLGAALDDAARARMAYLLTGDDNSLALYRGAVQRVEEKTRTLRELTRDNPVQQEKTSRLEQVNNSRLQVWEETIARKQRGESLDVVQVLPTNLDWSAKSAAALEAVRAEEVRLLQERSKVAHQRFVLTSTAIAVTFALAMLQLFYYYRLLNEELRLREASEQRALQAYALEADLRRKEREVQAQLEATNDELHKEVGERKAAEARLALSERSLRNLSRHLLRSQDEERKRIGRDLHDSLGQSLAVLKMNLDTLEMEFRSSEDSRVGGRVVQCIALVESILREVRTISYLLYPPMLEEMGLKSAIPWYLDGFAKRSNIQTKFEAEPGFERLAPEVELALFRILQESLTNIHRHSGSNTAQIRLLRDDGRALMEIRDEGKGIPANVLEQSGEDWMGSLGVGLRGMNERMRQLGGKLEVLSTGGGTVVLASVPYEQGNSRMDLSA